MSNKKNQKPIFVLTVILTALMVASIGIPRIMVEDVNYLKEALIFLSFIVVAFLISYLLFKVFKVRYTPRGGK